MGIWSPSLDVIKGATVDYMHRVCEGIVDQHLEKWSGSGENALLSCNLFFFVLTSSSSGNIHNVKTVKPTRDKLKNA